MKYLLDTHTLLWYALGDPQLSTTAKSLIFDGRNQALVSAASFWEVAIKVSLQKLTLHQPYDDFVSACISDYGFVILPVEPRHTVPLTAMPFTHKDPFDRLLAAQAIIEGIPIISNDPIFDSYGVQRLW